MVRNCLLNPASKTGLEIGFKVLTCPAAKSALRGLQRAPGRPAKRGDRVLLPQPRVLEFKGCGKVAPTCNELIQSSGHREYFHYLKKKINTQFFLRAAVGQVVLSPWMPKTCSFLYKKTNTVNQCREESLHSHQRSNHCFSFVSFSAWQCQKAAPSTARGHL